MFTKLNHLLVYILMFVYLFRHIQFIILHDKSESELKISAIQRKRNIEKKIDSDNRVKKRNIEPKNLLMIEESLSIEDFSTISGH
jgi:hypothetical protein